MTLITPLTAEEEMKKKTAEEAKIAEEARIKAEEAKFKEDVKTLLEFMRIKGPELSIRQSQLARIFFMFFILSAFLFLLVFDGVGAASLSVLPNYEISQIAKIDNPRAFVVLGIAFAIFFYFSRFGYLYYQATKDVAATYDVIGKILPLKIVEGTYLSDVRESLMQVCKSNYMVQSLIVFFYPANDKGRLPFIDGPLGNAPSWTGLFPTSLRVIVVKFLMILIIAVVGLIIAISQFTMLIVFFSFASLPICVLFFGAFFCYYYFYFELVFDAARRLRDTSLWFLATIAVLIILISTIANAQLFGSYGKMPEVLKCRVTWSQVEKLSSFSKIFMGVLFADIPSQQSTECGPKTTGIVTSPIK